MRNTFLTDLESDRVQLRPCVAADHEALFRVANDPLIWEQHNAHDRWKPGVFREFFTAGLENDLGMFVIISKDTGKVVGSTRYYKFAPEERAIRIGYTYFEKACWGTGLNRHVKQLMLDHAFQYANMIYFDVYEKNFRSQKALKRLGAHLAETNGDKLVFRLNKEDWTN